MDENAGFRVWNSPRELGSPTRRSTTMGGAGRVHGAWPEGGTGQREQLVMPLAAASRPERVRHCFLGLQFYFFGKLSGLSPKRDCSSKRDKAQARPSTTKNQFGKQKPRMRVPNFRQHTTAVPRVKRSPRLVADPQACCSARYCPSAYSILDACYGRGTPFFLVLRLLTSPWGAPCPSDTQKLILEERVRATSVRDEQSQCLIK